MRILLTLTLAVLTTLPALAQNAAKDYGSREPTTCSNRKAPLTAQTARQYAICDLEAYGANTLDLVGDVKVEVAPPRAYIHIQDSALDDIDVRQPVYAIRGSYTRYGCYSYPNLISGVPRSTNCVKQQIASAQGRCWKNSFAEWHCLLQGSAPFTGSNVDWVPPPSN